MKRKRLEKSGIKAIRILRESKLKSGLPFMINDKALPSDQCYFEYPNGKIVLVALSRKDNDFKIITKYSTEEGNSILKQFKFA
ncbi:MAG: hypothetical protein ABIN36_06855 [Ferruginibacter sp.]